MILFGSWNVLRSRAAEMGLPFCFEKISPDILIEGQNHDTEKLGQYSVLAGHFAKQGAVKTQAGAQEIQSMGSRSRAFKMDVTDPDEVERVVKAVEDELGVIDILVNNAAVMDNMGKFGEQQLGRWQRDLNVNLTGAYNCSKAVWPGMVKKSWGRIINISSVAGLMGAHMQPSYGATKAGLIGFSKSLAIEAGRYGITVNTVCPGFIATEAVQLVAMRDALIDGILAAHLDAYVIGHRYQRLPGHICLGLAGREGEAMHLLLELDANGFAVSTGSACSAHHTGTPSEALLAMGFDPIRARGSFRITLGRFNTPDEVQRFLEVFPGIVKQLRTIGER